MAGGGFITEDNHRDSSGTRGSQGLRGQRALMHGRTLWRGGADTTDWAALGPNRRHNGRGTPRRVPESVSLVPCAFDSRRKALHTGETACGGQ